MGRTIQGAAGILAGAVVLTLIILLAISLQKLESDEVGIKYDTFQKRLGDSPTGEGLHWGPPGFRFIKFPAVFLSFEFIDLHCLNKDGVTTQLSVRYQYKVMPEKLYELVLQFRDNKNFQQILRTFGDSAIHDSCSNFNTSQFQSERGLFQQDLRDRLVAKYAQIDTQLNELQINDIKRPVEYEAAVRDKEKAREDIEVAIQERPLAITEAETKKKEAETEAQIKISKAYSDARIQINRAEQDAQGIKEEYKREAATYARLMSAQGLNLTPEGFLGYLGVRTIQNAKNDLMAGMRAPAKASYLPDNP